MLYFQVVLCFIFLVLLRIWLLRRRVYRMAAKIPGYNGFPIIGVSYKNIREKFEDQYTNLAAFSKPFSGNFKIWYFWYLLLVVRDPDDIKIALNSEKCFEKPSFLYKAFNKGGMLVIGGDEYKLHRKTIMPIFSKQHLRQYLVIANAKMQNFLQQFDLKLDKKPFDFFHHASDFTLDTIMTTLFGRTIEKDLRVQFRHDAERCTQSYNELNMFHEAINRFCDNISSEIEHEHQTGIKSESRQPQIFLDHLYKIRGTMTYEDIRNELNTFIVAGYDTSAKAISGVLLLLAMNPTAQEKVLNEIKGIFVSDDDEIDDKLLDEMMYLDMVIKESLRLLPPVLLFVRQAQEDFKLTKYMVPKGTYLAFLTMENHTDKKYWGKDSLKFNPERFSKENFKNIHPYAYFPFSKGYRTCPGNLYAIMSIKVFLSKFLIKYRVATELKYDELKFIMALTTVVEQGFMMTVQRR